MKLVADDSRAGEVMRVTREKGIDYQLYRMPRAFGTGQAKL